MRDRKHRNRKEVEMEGADGPIEAGTDEVETASSPNGMDQIRAISSYMDELRIIIDSIPSGTGRIYQSEGIKLDCPADTKAETPRVKKSDRPFPRESAISLVKSKSQSGIRYRAPPYY